METITWLHLSDLHFEASDRFNRQVVLKALWNDIKACCAKGLRPDFILFTGDVAYHGKASEYRLTAEHFFDPLLMATGLGKEQLFIVPGNHDVDWDAIDPIVAAGCLAILTSRHDVNEFLASGRDRSHAFCKFYDYADFVNKYFGENLSFDDEYYFYVKTIQIGIGKRRVAVLGLNSAWMSGFAKDPDGGALDQGRLLVGERQVVEALKQAEEADLRIALMHHPFSWLQEEFDGKHVERLLRAECHFILHGHLHESQISIERTLEGNTVVIPAGAAYDRREWPNGYNFVQLDFEAGKGMVYLRRYSDRRRRWVEDIDAVEGGQFEFNLPEPLRPQELAPPEAVFEEKKKVTILVIDDDPTVANDVHYILERQGYKVQLALSDAEAVKLLRQTTFVLAIVDMVMEHRDSGFRILEFIQQDRPSTKVLILTGYPAMEDAVIAIRDKGAEGYVNKRDRRYLDILEREVERLIRR